MADRSVVVRLQAITTDFQQAMARAGQSVDNFGNSASGRLQTAGAKMEALGRGGQIMGGALVLGAGLAAKAFIDFDKQMSLVGAVSNASASDLERLRDAAVTAGQDTSFSASEAAAAEAELAKAGLSTSDILGGALTGSLSLAAAGGLELADAATISAQAMNMFGLAGGDVSHIADLLAAGANKSAADVGQLGAALSQSGSVAAQTGLGIEETVGALSAFADNALVGSDAGTSFKSMLQRLTPQSAEAQRAMDELGISAYDSQGKFVGLAQFAGQLQGAMKDLTPEARNAAMGVIFGADAVRAANVLYQEGESGIREYTAAVDDTGAASDMAGQMMNNLAGDLEQLRGSIETALIQSGSSGNDALRKLTQTATGLVNVVGGLPSPVLGIGIALGAAGGAAMLILPQIAKVKLALTTLGITATTTGQKLALLGKATAITAIVTIGVEAIAAKSGVDQLTSSIDDMINALNSGKPTDLQQLQANLDALTSKRDQFMSPTYWDFEKIGFAAGAALSNISDWIKPPSMRGDGFFDIGAKQIEEAQSALTTYNAVVDRVAASMGVSRSEALQMAETYGVNLTQGVDSAAESVVGMAKAAGETGNTGQWLKQGLTEVAAAAASAAEQVDIFTASVQKFMDDALGLEDAVLSSRDAFFALKDALKENGVTWDDMTKKGVANRKALHAAVRAAGEVAVAKYKETGSVEAANQAYRNSIEAGMEAAGMTDKQREAVWRLIGKEGLGSLAPEYFTNVSVNGVDSATASVQSLLAWLASLEDHWWTANVRTNWANTQGSEGRDGTATAVGGNVRKGSVRRIGELGTEMFVPETNGYIMPAHQVAAMMGAQTTSTVDNSRRFTIQSVTVQSAPSERAADSLPRALRRLAFVGGFGG